MSMEGASGRKRGLGRGLSALLGEEENPPGAREIPLDLIERNPHQPRTAFREADLDELAGSIRERGVLQPILVRPLADRPGRFEIVAGERRWRAAQRADLKTIPALVRVLSDEETLEVALVENLQRSDLNAMEEAAAYRTLMERGEGRTQEMVSELIGKSRSHVANIMRLLQLPPSVQALVQTGDLTSGHARALIGAHDPEALARRIIAEGLNVRDAEALARKADAKPKAAKSKDADTLALQRDLGERLGLKVDVRDRGGAGEVRIAYQTLEQLDELCRRLSRS